MSVVGKGSKLRKVPIHPAVAESLRALNPMAGQPVNHTASVKSEYILSTKTGKRLGVDAFTRMIDALSQASGVKIKPHLPKDARLRPVRAQRGRERDRVHLRLVEEQRAGAALHADRAGAWSPTRTPRCCHPSAGSDWSPSPERTRGTPMVWGAPGRSWSGRVR
jgi:hypothetical protein